MSTTRRPSTVSGLRRGVGTDPAGRQPGHLPAAPAQATAAAGPDDGRAEAYPGRIPLKVPEGMKRDLELAKADDHIEVSARIRAMIALWQQGGQFRTEVDALARTTGRPRQDRQR